MPLHPCRRPPAAGLTLSVFDSGQAPTTWADYRALASSLKLEKLITKVGRALGL